MKRLSIKNIFQQSQDSSQGHKKLIRALHKIFTKTDATTFYNEFLWCLKRCLIVSEKCPAVQRTLDFIAKFVCALDNPKSLENEDKKAGDTCSPASHSVQKDELIVEEKAADQEEDISPVFEFQMKIWSFLLGVHGANSQHVRLHVCQLVNKLLNSMNEDAEIDADLFLNLQSVMLKRIRDKINAVRVEAVLALARLQDSSDKDCPIFKAFIFHLGCDPHPEVRISILNCIIASKLSLVPVLRRTRDVKESVRKAAFIFIANKVHIKSLTIAQRLQVLKDGLHDRSDIVKKACKTFLLPKWLEMCNDNIVELLKCLDVEDDTDLIKEAVIVLLKQKKIETIATSCSFLDENFIIKRDELNADTVFYWRTVCEYLKTEGGKAADHLGTVLPDIPPFTGFVERYVEEKEEDTALKTLEKYFICEQFIGTLGMYDFADEVERRCLKELIDKLLMSANTPTTLIPSLIKLMKKYFSSLTDWLNYSLDIIPKIREVVEVIEVGMTSVERRNNELKIAKLKVDLNVLREELQGYIEKQDFSMAQEAKERIALLESSLEELVAMQNPKLKEVAEEKNDVVTLEKCLHIVCEVLQANEAKTISCRVLGVVENLVLTSIQNENDSVRKLAVKALGLACITDRKLAETHMILLLQVSQLDNEIVSILAIQAVFDILLIHGLDLFLDDDNVPSGEKNQTLLNETQPDVEKMTNSILSVLLSLFDTEYPEVHSVVAEGFGKLLYSRIIRSSKVLSRLIIMWYNPINKDNNHLCNFLGVFFPAFASNRLNQDLIMEAFLPTLKVLFDAPSTSPLCQVNVMNVAKFLVELTRPLPSKTSQLEDAPIHDRLCVMICNAVLRSKHLFKTTSLLKILILLKLSGTNKILLKDIDVLCQEILRRINDRVCQRMVQKFHSEVIKLGKFEVAEVAEGESPGDLNEETALSNTDKRFSGVLREKPLMENVMVEIPDEIFVESSDESY